MKIVVISDSHGNISNLRHVAGFAKKINAKGIIHCGDWNSVEAVNTVLTLKTPLYSVLGNADIDEKIAKSLESMSKKFDRTYLVLKLANQKVGLIHNLKHLAADIKSLSILFCGHTHRQEERNINGVKVVNPGAIMTGNNFAVYDTATNGIEFFSEP